MYGSSLVVGERAEGQLMSLVLEPRTMDDDTRKVESSSSLPQCQMARALGNASGSADSPSFLSSPLTGNDGGPPLTEASCLTLLRAALCQFVQATIVLSHAAGPAAPLSVTLSDSKGLDEQRCSRVIAAAEAAAREARSPATCSSSFAMSIGVISGAAMTFSLPSVQAMPGPQMLVALEAVADMLTELNHPDGDCTICLCPLEARQQLLR